MAKLVYAPGDTSKQIEVFFRDTSSTSAVAGKTGLVFNTSGLVCSYSREDDGNAGSTSVSLVTATRGTWVSGGFVEKDSTKQPGVYIFSIPNAALLTGSKWVNFTFQGATGIEQVNLEIELDPAASSSASASPTFHTHFIKQGTTSKRIEVFIRDTSSTSGAGLTGLVMATALSIAVAVATMHRAAPLPPRPRLTAARADAEHGAFDRIAGALAMARRGPRWADTSLRPLLSRIADTLLLARTSRGLRDDPDGARRALGDQLYEFVDPHRVPRGHDEGAGLSSEELTDMIRRLEELT